MNIVSPLCQALVGVEEFNHKSCKFVLWFGELKKEDKRLIALSEGQSAKFSENFVKVTRFKLSNQVFLEIY